MINSIVWVLMVYSHGGSLIPTIEFNTQEKCQKAIVSMVDSSIKSSTSWAETKMKTPKCFKVEK